MSLYDDDPVRDAEMAAEAWTRLTPAEATTVTDLAYQHSEVLFRILTAAAAWKRDGNELEHRRAMGRFYDYLGELDSNIVATIVAHEMWSDALFDAGQIMSADFGLLLGDEYVGRRRAPEHCTDPTHRMTATSNAGDGWRCQVCGGSIVQPGGAS